MTPPLTAAAETHTAPAGRDTDVVIDEKLADFTTDASFQVPFSDVGQNVAAGN